MKKTFSDLSVIVAVREQLSCCLDEETLILNLKSGAYYSLDAVGARIWSLIQEPTTMGEIQDVLLREYDVEPDSCGCDLEALLTQLADKGLIEVT